MTQRWENQYESGKLESVYILILMSHTQHNSASSLFKKAIFKHNFFLFSKPKASLPSLYHLSLVAEFTEPQREEKLMVIQWELLWFCCDDGFSHGEGSIKLIYDCFLNGRYSYPANCRTAALSHMEATEFEKAFQFCWQFQNSKKKKGKINPSWILGAEKIPCFFGSWNCNLHCIIHHNQTSHF